MTATDLDALTTAARKAGAPAFPPPVDIKLGGIDPLGLRQINFDVMDRLIPGTNNVTRNVRPFMLVTWAWRRALKLAKDEGQAHIDPDRLLDFVDRMEVIYAWSQFAADETADLPGGDTLKSLMAAPSFVFAGPAWEALRRQRRYSTALTAPVNYGPALKALRLLRPHQTISAVMTPAEFTEPAMKAFDKRIAERLDHPAFCRLGFAVVTAAEVSGWSAGWGLGSPTAAEREVMMQALAGDLAPPERQAAIVLVKVSAASSGVDHVDELRQVMCDPGVVDGPVRATAELWRYLQVRQLFRLALEGMFDWLLLQLSYCARTSAWLVDEFMRTATRLPLTRAYGELAARSAGSAQDMLRHILESWVLSQHVYWAVGRGLADARAGGKRILRLKVVLEERGWTLTAGTVPRAPQATGDRLNALCQLLDQCCAWDAVL